MDPLCKLLKDCSVLVQQNIDLEMDIFRCINIREVRDACALKATELQGLQLRIDQELFDLTKEAPVLVRGLQKP